MKRQHKKSQVVLLVLIFINALIIVIAPFYNLTFFSLPEDASEAVFILIMFLLMAALSGFYAREVNKYKRQQEALEDRLRETFKYIGSTNLQLEEMKKVFSRVNKYPENKKDIQALFVHTAERILGIINADWVMLKVLDIRSGKNLHEYFIARANKNVPKIKIDNQELLNDQCSFGSCDIIKSQQKNFNIKAFCVLPAVKKNDNQEFLINSIVSQLEMLFIIFNSLYYKKD